ncbi:hypothetical protein HNV11_21415 [Spirosoma taeanense]|uniref:Uncharacterized protein n=1 Tax=Spirosoma taeanense TaxID=2735870 RepID=A0A6M5YCH0_9BACT|nr:hypothetical protein [Spirosoma taeanense]QJW91755.1 hypothetical protein HNV11_21415 [Spirosoma taeanense]
MKHSGKLISAVVLTLLLAVASFNSAQAQLKSTTTAEQLAAGLTNLQQGLVNANVNLSNLTIQDLVNIGKVDVKDVVNVNNVLNKNEITALNNLIRDITITNVLNDLLRNANILNKNQAVVGLLSRQFVVQNVNQPTNR